MEQSPLMDPAPDSAHAENPYQPPVSLMDQGMPVGAAHPGAMPWTVTAVAVIVGFIGLSSLINVALSLGDMLLGRAGSAMGFLATWVLHSALTVTVVVGLARGRRWARSLSLVLAYLGFGVAALMTTCGLIVETGAPRALGMALPLLLVALVLNLPIMILLHTRSAKQFFGLPQ